MKCLEQKLILIFCCFLVSFLCLGTILADSLSLKPNGGESIIVNNPRLLKALQQICKVQNEINRDCYVGNEKKPNKVQKCLCKRDNVNKLFEAEKEKAEAFAQLLEKNPNLKDKTIIVEGAFGAWIVPTAETVTLKGTKKQLGCKW